MKSLIFAVAAASVLSMPLASFAQSNHPLTRAEVKADLVRVEKAGYNPVAADPYYPADIQAAESRVAQQQGLENTSVGGAAAGSAQSGAAVEARPMNVDGVHPLFFGR
jgi:Domain of unknown function (DUF4148)